MNVKKELTLVFGFLKVDWTAMPSRFLFVLGTVGSWTFWGLVHGRGGWFGP